MFSRIRAALGESGWLLILLPGFLTVGIARFFSNLESFSEFELTLLCLSFSMLNMGIVLIVSLARWPKRVGVAPPSKGDPADQHSSTTSVGTVPISGGAPAGGGAQQDAAETMDAGPLFDGRVYGLTLCTSVLLGVITAVVYEQDWTRDVVRWSFMKDLLPKASSHETIEVLLRKINTNDLEALKQVDFRIPLLRQNSTRVQIKLEDASTVFEGVPRRWASVGESKQVYLSPACTVEGENIVLIDGPGVWIRFDKAEYAMLIDSKVSKCAAMYYEAAKQACSAEAGVGKTYKSVDECLVHQDSLNLDH